MTEDDKKTLHYDRSTDDGGEFPLKRARTNRTLKRELSNDCFSDATIACDMDCDVTPPKDGV